MSQTDIDDKIGSQLELIGWRQGSILNDKDFELLIKDIKIDFEMPYNAVAVVISHSCDIASDNLEQGPFIDLLIGQKIDQEDGRFTHNKHPRKLHTQILHKKLEEQQIEKITIEFYGYRTFRLSKIQFQHIKPNSNLIFEDIHLYNLCGWLSGRVNRSAFPTNFNNRISKAFSKIRKKAKSGGKDITGIYMQISPDTEIDDSEKYYVNILALVSEDFQGNMSEPENFIGQYAEIMKSCNIDVLYSIVRETEISVALLRKFKRVNFDDLTIREHSQLPFEINI